jgi:hypothetical protein
LSLGWGALGQVAKPGRASVSLPASGCPARRSRRGPGRVDGPGVSRPPPDAGIWAPGRGMRGEAQARTCPLPGPGSPSRPGSKGRSHRPGLRPGHTDSSPGRPPRPPRPPPIARQGGSGRPGRWAGDNPAHLGGEPPRDALNRRPGGAALRTRGLRTLPIPQVPRPPRDSQPISAPRAAQLPYHTPSPPPSPLWPRPVLLPLPGQPSVRASVLLPALICLALRALCAHPCPSLLLLTKIGAPGLALISDSASVSLPEPLCQGRWEIVSLGSR